jgi:methionine--tRNA ligase beta chain
MINYEEFQKIEIKIGKILSAEKIPETDKLLKLSVSFGKKLEESKEGETEDIRQIVSGISLAFPDPQALIGMKCAFVANLEPRVIKGFESQGMILAVGTPNGAQPFSLFKVPEDIPEGSRAK